MVNMFFCSHRFFYQTWGFILPLSSFSSHFIFVNFTWPKRNFPRGGINYGPSLSLFAEHKCLLTNRLCAFAAKDLSFIYSAFKKHTLLILSLENCFIKNVGERHFHYQTNLNNTPTKASMFSIRECRFPSPVMDHKQKGRKPWKRITFFACWKPNSFQLRAHFN